MKRILVTGASGLLGLNFGILFCRKYDVLGISNRTKLNNLPFKMITHDLIKGEPGELLDDYRPDVILHCAAMANIDQCELFPDSAEKINSIFPGKLAWEAGKRNIRFVHISTDAVFDGEDCGSCGYTEESPVNPISKYAETKLHGEKNVLDSNPDALVARVNFYGWSTGGKRSLVEFFYNNLSSGNAVNGFSDVYFSTLYVRNLAKILDEMIARNAKGIYHVFSRDHQSKYDFGVSIAKKFGFSPELIRPVSWKEGGLTAKRSPNLIMNTNKLQALLEHDLPAQKECLESLYNDTMSGVKQQIQSFSQAKTTEE